MRGYLKNVARAPAKQARGGGARTKAAKGAATWKAAQTKARQQRRAADAWSVDAMRNCFDYFEENCWYYMYDFYDSEAEARSDCGEGPFTYRVFVDHYGSAAAANEAWLAGTPHTPVDHDADDDFAPAPAPAAVHVCDVCDEPLALVEAATARPVARCREYGSTCSGSTCNSCARSWVRTHVEAGSQAVKCPSGCQHSFTRLDVRVACATDPALYRAFVALANHNHAAKTAETYADPDTGAWARANTTKCPDCCQLVERSTGCPHMSCVCGGEFCYNCGRAWRGFNHVCRSWRLRGDAGSHDVSHITKSRAYCTALGLAYTTAAEDAITGSSSDHLAAVSGCSRPLLDFAAYGSAAAASLLVEWRIDAEDGVAYPRAAFLLHHGVAEGVKHWAAASVDGLAGGGGGGSSQSNACARTHIRGAAAAAAIMPRACQNWMLEWTSYY